MKLSYSRISLFEQCPLAYKFHYIDCAPSRPSTARDLGVLLHLAFSKIGSWSGTPEELWSSVWPAGNVTTYDTYASGLDILTELYPAIRELYKLKVLGVEKELSFNLEDNGITHEVETHLDLILGEPSKTITIVDYKTGNYVPSAEEAHDSLQKAMYFMAVRAHYPDVKKIRFILWYIRSNETFEMEIKEEEGMDSVFDYLFATGQKIEEQIKNTDPDFKGWAPRMNDFCPYCDYRSSCPLFNSVIKYTNLSLVKLDPTNPERAIIAREEVCNTLKLLESLKTEIDTWIKSKILREGDFELGGSRYTMIPYKQSDLPTMPVAYLLEKVTGKPVDHWVKSLTTINKSALDGIVRDIKKRDPELGKSLARAIESEKQPRPPSYRLHITKPK